MAPKKKATRKPRRSRLPRQCLAGLLGACTITVEPSEEGEVVARLLSDNGQEIAAGRAGGPLLALCNLADSIANCWEMRR